MEVLRTKKWEDGRGEAGLIHEDSGFYSVRIRPIRGPKPLAWFPTNEFYETFEEALKAFLEY